MAQWRLIGDTSSENQSSSEHEDNSNKKISNQIDDDTPSEDESMSDDASNHDENTHDRSHHNRNDHHHHHHHNNNNHRHQEMSRELREYLKGKPVLSVNKTRTYLRDNNHAGRISRKAAAALTGTVQCLIIELIREAGFQARKSKKKRISPRILCMAIKNDEELSKLLSQVTIPDCGLYGMVGALSNPDLREDRQYDEEE